MNKHWKIMEKCETFPSTMVLALLVVLLGVFFFTVAFAAQGEDSDSSRGFAGERILNAQIRPALSKGKFLVADRNMRDPRFAESVLLLVDYGPQGAMGLIINRPTEVRLSSVFPKIAELKHRNDVVYLGGPVNIDRMFLLIRSVGNPEESVHVFDGLYISSSEKTLRHLVGHDDAGKRIRVFGGYAGWAPQQLDHEVERGDWHILQADAKTIFEKKSSDIWPELIQRSSRLWVDGRQDFMSPDAAATCTNTDMIHFQASLASQGAIPSQHQISPESRPHN